MKKVLIILIGLFLLTSCASPTMYRHRTKSPGEFQRDNYDCRKDARQAVAYMGFAGNPFIESQEYHNCLKMKHGWYSVKE